MQFYQDQDIGPDPNDVTLLAHADALRFAAKSASNDDDLSQRLDDRLFFLLLKNVSRDDPMSTEEKQELREFRRSISGEQWQQWLQFARNEKKKMNQSSGSTVLSQASDDMIPSISLNEIIRLAFEHKASQQQPNKGNSSADSRKSIVEIPRVQAEMSTAGEPIDIQRRSIAPSLGQSTRSNANLNNSISSQRVITPASRPQYNDDTMTSRASQQSNSLYLEGVSTSKPTSLRAQSAPRNRPTVSTGLNNPPPFRGTRDPSIADYSTRPLRSSHIPRSPQAMPSTASPTNSTNRFQNLLAATLTTPADNGAAVERRMMAVGRSFEDSQAQDDLRAALETAQMGSNRVENACTAAKYLLHSLQAISSQVDAVTNHSLDRSRTVLQEMLSSLEKSKHNFGSIEQTVAKNLHVNDLGHASMLDDEEEGLLSTQEQRVFSEDYLRYGALDRTQPQSRSQAKQQQQYDDEENSIGNTSQSNNHGNALTASSRRNLVWSPAKSLSNTHTSFEAQQQMQQSAVLSNWGLITRICLNRGSLVKAYEEFPIRADMESMSVDVVWREPRADYKAGMNSSSQSVFRGQSSFKPLRGGVTAKTIASAHNNWQIDNDIEQAQRILRRERFQFDAMYVGLSADKKMAEYLRYRTRAAIENCANMVFICNACGDSIAGDIEPSVNIALGSGGGSGVASSILQEAFKYVNSTHVASEHGDSYLRSSVQNTYLSTKMAQENRISYLSMSAVLINGRTIVDLLSNGVTAMNSRGEALAPKIVKSRSTGEVLLTGVTSVDLSNAMDFERIVGALIGRRTGINETMKTFNVPMDVDTYHDLPLASFATWNTTATTANLLSRGQGQQQSENTEEAPSTMLLSFRVALGSAIFPRRVVYLRIVCPCGRAWNQPNFDLNLLAESVGALPHSPPDTLLAISPLTMLLTDISSQPCNFVSIVGINRLESVPNNRRMNNHIPQKPSQNENEIAVGALNAMRVACLAR